MLSVEPPPGPRPSGDMLTAHLLALLKGWTAYGYDLVQRLDAAGFGDYNKGSVYRALRQMEALGMVSSHWDTASEGPARRMYTVTPYGLNFLQSWLAIFDAQRKALEGLLNAVPIVPITPRSPTRRPRQP
jgi:PadR family transcriptional regulator PadR